jgi:hypothetical protein
MRLYVMILFLVCAGLRAQEQGSFAFADTTGKRLLSLADVAQPSALNTALCEGGRRYPVRFAGHQQEREGTNHRHTAANFDLLPGDLYTVVQGTVPANASCFLTSDASLASATLLSAAPPANPSVCPADVFKRMAALRARAVRHCWTIAGNVMLVEFARQGKDVLAALVLQDGDRAIFQDYAAEFVEEGGDLWRVDDNGVLRPEDFHVLFLLKRGTSYTLGLAWSGPEGAALSAAVSTGQDRFTKIIEAYRYWAPL